VKQQADPKRDEPERERTRAADQKDGEAGHPTDLHAVDPTVIDGAVLDRQGRVDGGIVGNDSSAAVIDDAVGDRARA